MRAMDAYSGFDDTQLNALLRSVGILRVFIGGLAAEYCVLNTVKDALRYGYVTFVLEDAVRAIDVTLNHGGASGQMSQLGALPIQLGMLNA
jgi:nicotinamidase/pyrazinamidase